MNKLFFFFLEQLSKERLDWLNALLYNHNIQDSPSNDKCEITFFLSGESLYSLFDGRTKSIWMNSITTPRIKLYLDYEELKILGLSIDLLRENYTDKILKIPKDLSQKFNFWDNLLEKMMMDKLDSCIAFLQNDGPYMHRTSLYSVRLMRAAIERELNAEFYGYLDGVHIGHKCQKPSEFENISQSLLDIKKKATEKNLNFSMYACSRCGTARGYIRSQPINDFYMSDDTIPHYNFCNLNKIIDQFEKNHLIFSSSSALIIYDNQDNGLTPGLTIFITHSPYASEWTFGGISFAVASSSHNIFTQVIFIEDGVYSLIGEPQIQEKDKIYNLHDILEATADMENLEFYAHSPSLKKRNMELSNNLKSVPLIDNEELMNIILKNNRKGLYYRRIIFF